MYTTKFNNIDGVNNLNASGLKFVGGAMKFGGTSTFDLVAAPVAGDPNMTGNSNAVFSSAVITGSSPVGNSITFAVAASTAAIGPATDIQKLDGVNLGDNGYTIVGTNPGDLTPTVLINSNLTQLRDGRYVNSSGVLASPTGSGYAYPQIVSGSGDVSIDKNIEYFMKQGGTVETEQLGPRT